MCARARHRPGAGARARSRSRGNIGPGVGAVSPSRTAVDSLDAGDRVLLHGDRLGPERLRHSRSSGDAGVAATRHPALPAGLPGLDPAWSRLVTVDGRRRRRRAPGTCSTPAPTADPVGTLLCVHGNPTWSYLWRRLLAARARRLAGRRRRPAGHGLLRAPGTPPAAGPTGSTTCRGLTAALGVTGPVVTRRARLGRPDLAGLGAGASRPAARRRADQHRGAPARRLAGRPALIRLAHVLARCGDSLCVRTPSSCAAPPRCRGRALPRDVRAALRRPVPPAPSAGARDRGLRRRHPVRARAPEPAGAGRPSPTASAGLATCPRCCCGGRATRCSASSTCATCAAGCPTPTCTATRAPSHLLPEDAPHVRRVSSRGWLGDLDIGRRTAAGGRRAPRAVRERRGRPTDARRPVVAAALADRADERPARDGGRRGRRRERSAGPSWTARVRETAAGLVAGGVRPGDRVALLVPPVDRPDRRRLRAAGGPGRSSWWPTRASGCAAMGRALRGAGPGPRRRHRPRVWPPRRAMRAARRARHRRAGDGAQRRVLRAARLPPRRSPGWPQPGRRSRRPARRCPGADDAEAAVVFTSGATGPAKGVLYLHRQVQAQLERGPAAPTAHRQDRIVAGVRAVRAAGPGARDRFGGAGARTSPTPATLTAAALADAAAAVDATRGVRLAGGVAQRGRPPPARSAGGPAGGAGPGPAADVGGRPGAAGAAAPAEHAAAGGRGRTPRTA